MTDKVQLGSSPCQEGIRERTEALAGAFTEGIDLGPRGAQIRGLGQAFKTAIDALRLKLVELSGEMQFDAEILSLDQLTRMARAAQAYGTD